MLSGLVMLATIAMTAQSDLKPIQPVPTPRQLAWQKLEYYAFIHFGPNTFTDQEWGHGTEKPDVFNPTALDCRQWVRTFKEAGMKQVIITAKHHDGFCLWPSAYSTHTVAQSKWKGGKGDVLMELRKACNEYGLKMGVYLSPWDRNHPKYGTPEYNQVFADMLKEVLTKYGPIYEVWFDGANGEGPNGKKQVYDWKLFNETVRRYAPDAVIFSDAGPDIRWVGNEAGYAPETCWSMIKAGKFQPGVADQKELGTGLRDGDQWTPAECDVSIRPGWFYHASQDGQVKTAAQLMDLYERSVGHNGSLLLNVPPDRRGLIHENDVRALMEFKKLRDETYGKNLAKGSKPIALAKPSDFTTVGNAAAVADTNPDTYWQPGTQKSGGFTIRLPKPTTFDRVCLQEKISLGQRVEGFTISAKVDGDWKELAKGTTIGAKRIVRVPATTSDEIAVEITKSRATPAISEVAVYATPNAKYAVQKETKDQKDKRMAWWRDARYGMFIHWGLYSIPAGEWNGRVYGGASEWLMNTAKIPVKDYQPLRPQFNPYKFDAKKWVQIAKDAGMKYIVITSKHHDGFAMFDSQYTDWDIMNTPFKRDPLKELAKACEEAGIVLCFYHSIMDWTHPDYAVRRPWDMRPETPTNMDRYTQFMKNQLKELLTNYGKIGILWFDGEWEPAAWTHERGVDLYHYVRSLQPNIIINNRVDVHRSGMAGMSASDEAMGDYGTPEQEIPANGMPGVDWESCMTMNGSWGFHKADHNWKSAKTLVQNLIDCASKGGNYLLNVGPTALGEIPEESVKRLADVGQWLQTNGESIYGTQAGPFPKPLSWGRVTAKPGKLYLHVFEKPGGEIELPGFSAKIKSVQVLNGFEPLKWRKDGDSVFVETPKTQGIPAGMPVVILMEIDGKATVVTIPIRPAADGTIALNAVDATVKGTSAAYEADKRAIGYWTNVKDTVEWEFEVKSRGEYDVTVELACEPGSEGATYEVQIAGQNLKSTVKATKGWSDFVSVNLGRVAIVVPGKIKVVVKPLSKPGLGVMNLRALKLVPKS
ncbi:MAG: alpha-L-fucosidase [Fimbriimonadaceae bacterium]|nr:alpha-L-fucosidase [Fimbriimonadaceae bacterium]